MPAIRNLKTRVEQDSGCANSLRPFRFPLYISPVSAAAEAEGQMSDVPNQLWGHRVGAIAGLVGASAAAMHLWTLSAAIAGRDAFSARFLAGFAFRFEAVLGVSLALAFAYLVGAHAALRDVGTERRRLFALSAALALPMVGAHLWILSQAVSPEPEAVLSALFNEVGKPWLVGLYSFGLAAFGLHWGESALLFLPERWRRAGGPVAYALGACFFLFAVNVLSHFAAGRALVGAP